MEKIRYPILAFDNVVFFPEVEDDILLEKDYNKKAFDLPAPPARDIFFCSSGLGMLFFMSLVWSCGLVCECNDQGAEHDR